MLILLPVIMMLLTALVLSILYLARPNFEFSWILATGGAILALVSVFLWQIHLPGIITLSSWQLPSLFVNVTAWIADEISWTYALALATLAAAVITTSVARAENKPIPWVGTLILTAFGILAVAAENPLTLLLAWSAIDISELISMLRSTQGKRQIEGAIIAFTVRLIGTGLLLWATLVSISSGTSLDFRSTSQSAGIYLLIASGLRLGVLPLHLPYQQENVLRRGFGTTLRLVSATASLALLARIAAISINSALTPYLLILSAIAALYAGWMWLRSSDEITGRPFWILGFASLAVAESLLGNPIGSTCWGVAMILIGGYLFLFSARWRSILWLPFMGIWTLSALPFSLTASSWQTGNTTSILSVIPFLPAQALLLAGFLRHSIRSGDANLNIKEKWVKAIYPIGLLLLMIIALLLGFWGWAGARTVGQWGLAVIVLSLSAGFTFLALRVLIRFPTTNFSNKWPRIFQMDWLIHLLGVLFNFLRTITNVISVALEGDGGLLWSFLLLALILSIISTNNH
jgi:hypothetical protein